MGLFLAEQEIRACREAATPLRERARLEVTTTLLPAWLVSYVFFTRRFDLTLVSVLSGDDDVEDIREDFPDLLESFSDNYDYSSDSDLEVDDEEVEPHEAKELQGAAEATHLGDDAPAADDEKCGDILYIEKEDAQSESSGVLSVSDVEAAFADLDDIKCVLVNRCPLPVPASDTNLTCDHGVTDFRHMAKTVVIPDVAFVT